MSPEEFRKLGHNVVNWIADYRERVGERPVMAQVKPGDIKKQLRPYRSHMDQAVYEQTFENLLLKRLREQFGVPRLSLFYL